ncbi:YidH family protein [Embleya sp. NPDC001921]
MKIMRSDRKGSRLREIGDEPDYRFTLANERTFLAWIRTALALLAGGVAVVQLVPDLASRGQRLVLGLALIALALTLSATAYRRWYRVERAMRLGHALPFSAVPLVLSVGLVVVIVLSALLMIAS